MSIIFHFIELPPKSEAKPGQLVGSGRVQGVGGGREGVRRVCSVCRIFGRLKVASLLWDDFVSAINRISI